MYYLRKKKKKEKPLPLFDKAGVKVKKKTDYTAKLDKVFSEYIRMRDVMPNGLFRCISCGKIKPYSQADCGHYHSRKHMATRFDEDNCHAECSYCLTPDALILTKDLQWKKLGEITVGEKIFAFDENKGSQLSRHWKEGTVIHIHREIQDVYEVILENGDVIKTTAEHQWLSRKRSRFGYDWVATKDLWVNGYNLQGKKKTGPHTEKTTSIVCKPILVIEQDKSYESGWLAGMIDADGHLCQQNIHDKDGSIRYGFRIGVAQSETYPELCDKIISLMEKFTNNNKPCRQFMQMGNRSAIKSRVKTWQYLVTGTNVEKIHFLMKIRPNKMSKLDINKLGCIRSRYDSKVKSITPIGKQEIVVMETDTHTFIANGYAMHNCNRFSADHLIGYRENLIQKIGEQRFELLSWKAHQTKKWSDFELQELIKYYKALRDKLKKEKGL